MRDERGCYKPVLSSDHHLPRNRILDISKSEYSLSDSVGYFFLLGLLQLFDNDEITRLTQILYIMGDEVLGLLEISFQDIIEHKVWDLNFDGLC